MFRIKPLLKLMLILFGLCVYIAWRDAGPEGQRRSQEQLRQSEVDLAAAKERLARSLGY